MGIWYFFDETLRDKRKPRLQWKLYEFMSHVLTAICLKFVNLVRKKKNEIMSKLESAIYFLLAIRYYFFKGYCIMQSLSIIQKLIIFHKEKQKKIMFNELIKTR